MKIRKVITILAASLFVLPLYSCANPEETATSSAEMSSTETVETLIESTQETTSAEVLAPVIQPREPDVFDQPAISDENALNFASLLEDLVWAYESPTGESAASIDSDLTAIQSVSELDYELATSIVDNWNEVFLDPDYQIYYYQGSDMAPEVAGAGITNSSSHAIVILGYELQNGQMQDELIGRLDAAASLADAYPDTLIFCSGGATGANNSAGNTEAGLMRDYLIDECGIDPARVIVDERAMTTAENALNTFAMMRDNGVHSMTIVTSSYHIRWGQAVYNVVASLYCSRIDYNIESVANYCYDTEPSVYVYSRGDRFAAHQIGEILDLSSELLNSLPSVYN